MIETTHESWIIAGAIFLSAYILAVLGYFAFRQYLRFKTLELELSSRMSPLRSHLESTLSTANEKYLSTPRQWEDAYHLLTAAQRKAAEPNRPHRVPANDEFLYSHGITDEDTVVEPNLVFVLTPFLEEFSATFNAIQQTCSSVGLICVRGDEGIISGEIFPHILKQIVKARIVIANITGRNPNVFYELGIAHALDKPVIMLARWPEELPFDVRTKNVIFYKDDQNLQALLNESLLKIFVKR